MAPYSLAHVKLEPLNRISMLLQFNVWGWTVMAIKTDQRAVFLTYISKLFFLLLWPWCLDASPSQALHLPTFYSHSAFDLSALIKRSV